MLTVRTYLAPSRIHGIGLFAGEPIPKGTVVWSLRPGLDITLEETEIEALEAPSREQVLKYTYYCRRRKGYVLCGDDARFFNHSSTPNCHDVQTGTEDLTLAARDIDAGEELTCDYALFDGRHAPEGLHP